MLNEFGQEIPDDTPVVINLPGVGQVNMLDDVKKFIDIYMSQRAAAEGMETIEDANDFEVDDDLFPVSPHEYDKETELADLEALQVAANPQATTGKPVVAAPPAEAPTGPASPPADAAAQ